MAVELTGYIPNLLAGGLKSKRSLMVASLVPTISVSQFLPTVQALTSTLDEAGYQLILGQSGYDHAREEALLNTMMSRRPDGIVITGLVHSPQARARLLRAGIPVVETWDLSDRPVDMLVGFSHLKVGSAVAGYFLSKGWQRVGIATADDQRGRMRREGFVATLGREVPTAWVPAPSSLALGRRALADLLAQEPALQAVCCSSDSLAQGVIVEAQARGLRVPQELAVCGFGGADFAAHLQPSLTTVDIDGAEIGRLAAELILQRCRGESVAQPVIDVGFRIIERQSTVSG
jgi:LacI family gluconate utilization system Gnt-I transcriptional repressor